MGARTDLFPPGSAIRRIGAESVLLVAGGRALLLQVAHPLVAAGVAQHSGFAADPWRRLARTMQAVYGIVFGTADEAARIGEAVRRAHGRVHGALAQDVGPYAAGTPYRADDPALMLWVHATLVDSALVAYESFVRPLPDEDRADFLRDMNVVATLFGTPPEVLPADLDAFAAYREAMLDHGLAVGDDARAIARTILAPPAPLPLRPGLRIGAQLLASLVPEPLLAPYGLRPGRGERALVSGTAALSRRAVPLLPARVRLVGAAERRTIPNLVLRAMARPAPSTREEAA